MTAKVTLRMTCWSSILGRYFKSNSIQISIIVWVKYSRWRADNRDAGRKKKKKRDQRRTWKLQQKERQKEQRTWKAQSGKIRRTMKQGIFLPPLPKAMGDLFFLISIICLHDLALNSESFSFSCLLTVNLWDAGLDSGHHLWAKQSWDRDRTYIQSLFLL